MRFLAVIFICLILAVNVCTKTPCKIPAQLEGRFSAVNSKFGITDLGTFSSDAVSRRFRTSQFIIVDNYTMFLDELMLFNEKVLYQISYTTQTCVKMPLPLDIYPMELPPDAKLAGQVTLGNTFIPGQNFRVDSWEGSFPSLGVKYSIVTTSVGCVPVSSLVYTKDTGLLYAGYYDVVRGIKDPSVFEPPSFCNTQNLEDIQLEGRY